LFVALTSSAAFVTSDFKERKGERNLVRCKNILKISTILDKKKVLCDLGVWDFFYNTAQQITAQSLTFDTPIHSVKQAGQMNKHFQ